MKELYVVSLDEEFQKARKLGAKDIKKRKKRIFIKLPGHKERSEVRPEFVPAPEQDKEIRKKKRAKGSIFDFAYGSSKDTKPRKKKGLGRSGKAKTLFSYS